MAADIGKLAAGRVRNFLLGENAVADLFLQIAIGIQLLKIDVQHRLGIIAVIIRLCAADAF